MIDQLTIIKTWHGGFTVITSEGHCAPQLRHATDLNYDEMLGTVARLFCPSMSNGEAPNYVGRALFLAPPKENP